MEELGQDAYIHQSWRLNERHYGSLQGQNKKECADKYGTETMMDWCQSYDGGPPKTDHHPKQDSLYEKVQEKDLLPVGESLHEVKDRI